MVENRKKHRQNSHPIIHCPTSEEVSSIPKVFPTELNLKLFRRMKTFNRLFGHWFCNILEISAFSPFSQPWLWNALEESVNFEMTLISAFLVACTRLYKPLCRSVRRSVGPSVSPSVTLYFFFAKWLIELRVRDLRRSALFIFKVD